MPSHFAEIELARLAAAVETGKSSFAPIENTRCGKNARIRAARPDSKIASWTVGICIYICMYIHIEREWHRNTYTYTRGYHESTRGAISGVYFAPRSRDQLRGSLR